MIESKVKPSKPYGELGQDAFGNYPQFQNKGYMKRAIIGSGNQDVLVEGLTPVRDFEILGSSSDHIILDTKDNDLKVGDEVAFQLNYGALLSGMTSPCIIKNYQYHASKIVQHQ